MQPRPYFNQLSTGDCFTLGFTMVDVRPLLKEDFTGNVSEAGPQQNKKQQQDESEAVVMPSAPPEQVQGYEGASFNTGGYVAPPADNEAVQPEQRNGDRPAPTLPTHVTEQQARDSLSQLTEQHFCWGKKAAREMVISSITSSSAFHYKLETFTEARKSAWAFEPYYGGIVDGPFNGPAPSPWLILIQPDIMFKSQEKNCEVPHTAYVKPCHDCNGMGRRACRQCNGGGRAVCFACTGKGYKIRTQPDGRDDREKCFTCNGSGYRICSQCSGCGQVNCKTCKARTQLRFFIRLTIIWTVHVSDHIVETTAMPDHLVREAQGVVAFEESFLRVYPVGHFPNAEINSASQRLVHKHNTSYNNERILMQRHKIRVVPVSEIEADHLGKEFTYWVYGNNNLCYASRYPQQCCCGCNIL